jgi:hypothetical protein
MPLRTTGALRISAGDARPAANRMFEQISKAKELLDAGTIGGV